MYAKNTFCVWVYAIWIERASKAWIRPNTHTSILTSKCQCFERAVQSIWEICCCCCCCYIPRNIYKQSPSTQAWVLSGLTIHIVLGTIVCLKSNRREKQRRRRRRRRKMRDVEQWLTIFSCFDTVFSLSLSPSLLRIRSFEWCLLLSLSRRKLVAAAATATAQLLLRSMRILRMSHDFFDVYERATRLNIFLACSLFRIQFVGSFGSLTLVPPSPSVSVISVHFLVSTSWLAYS